MTICGGMPQYTYGEVEAYVFADGVGYAYIGFFLSYPNTGIVNRVHQSHQRGICLISASIEFGVAFGVGRIFTGIQKAKKAHKSMRAFSLNLA